MTERRSAASSAARAARSRSVPSARPLRGFSLVAGLGDGPDEGAGDVAEGAHGGAPGREIDGGIDDAGHRPQRPLDPPHAGRAGHAGDPGRDRPLGGLVADVADRLRHLGGLGARPEPHPRPLGRQVHGRRRDALDGADRALDPPDAGRAGHAADRDVEDRFVLPRKVLDRHGRLP